MSPFRQPHGDPRDTAGRTSHEGCNGVRPRVTVSPPCFVDDCVNMQEFMDHYGPCPDLRASGTYRCINRSTVLLHQESLAGLTRPVTETFTGGTPGARFTELVKLPGKETHDPRPYPCQAQGRPATHLRPGSQPSWDDTL